MGYGNFNGHKIRRGMMGQIFLSYARKDAKVVDRLMSRLEAAGYKVWVDRTGIPGGEQWRRQIVRAIENADAFLIALSPHSVISDNVRKELDLAEGAKKRVLPVIIQPVEIPEEMKYQLVGLQKVELVTNFDAGFETLLRTLEGGRGTAQSVSQPLATQTGKTWRSGCQYIFALGLFGALAAGACGIIGAALGNLTLGEGGELIGGTIGAILALITVFIGAWLQGFRSN
jgi:hypothetical protein